MSEPLATLGRQLVEAQSIGGIEMADYPPYMNASGNVEKILTAIKEAKAPDRFTQDFLAQLGFTGGSARPFIPLAKRLGLLSTDGVPTELYHSFRNPSTSRQAMAQAIRKAYGSVFSVNERADKLDKSGLTGLIMQITGLEKGSSTLTGIVGTFEALKGLADFDAPKETASSEPDAPSTNQAPLDLGALRFGYTINLNLPDTSDIAVFNAIFKSMRQHLLEQ
jgi:hypothetical protein